MRGKIQYIAPALDPTTRTLQARIEADNPGERLKKDMYVTAQVRAGVIPNALMVPDAAVLRDTENMPYVYVQTGDNQFARRMVTLGESQGGKTQILTGLQAGRQNGGRRQPVPAIPEFAATLSRGATQHMIHHFVQFALRQRFLILMLIVLVIVAGALSFQRMPVDAYPDLSPPMVEIITQWPGHAAEEVERLVTLPIEVEMNGVPHMEVMRSISLYGLSDVMLTFEESTDDYFARQVVFERLGDVQLPSGVTPGLSPLFSPSGLVYRYVLESPDRSPQELKTIEDWVIERAYKSVPGVADDSGLRRHGDAIPGAARSGEDLQLSHRRAAGDRGAVGQQRQRRRRILFAGRAVFLRARPGPGDQDGGHRQHRRRKQ